MIKIEKECYTCKGIGQVPDVFNKGSFRDCSNCGGKCVLSVTVGACYQQDVNFGDHGDIISRPFDFEAKADMSVRDFLAEIFDPGDRYAGKAHAIIFMEAKNA